MIAVVRTSVVRLGSHVSTLRRRIKAAGVERTLFICSTPRTGSTMLGDLLADTGLVGHADEYFGEVFRQDVVPGLSRRGFDDYLVACTQHAHGTGTFGIKLHWDQVEVFLYLLRLRRGLHGLDDAAVIEAIFPSPSFVWMRRRDTVAQAVSWWKAMGTGKWTDGQAVTGEPRSAARHVRGARRGSRLRGAARARARRRGRPRRSPDRSRHRASGRRSQRGLDPPLPRARPPGLSLAVC